MTKRTLVVDDKAIKKSFTPDLSGMPYGVDTAESGEKGIEIEKGLYQERKDGKN